MHDLDTILTISSNTANSVVIVDLLKRTRLNGRKTWISLDEIVVNYRIDGRGHVAAGHALSNEAHVL
jgi:hypothetical protein